MPAINHHTVGMVIYRHFWLLCFVHNIIIHTHAHPSINDGCISYLPFSSDHLAQQLYEASRNGHDQEVLELLQKGAPLNNSDYYTEQGGWTPLHWACACNHLCSAELLIKFGAIVTATTADYGWTPLHLTCAYNKKDTAKLLLEHHCPTGEPGC